VSTCFKRPSTQFCFAAVNLPGFMEARLRGCRVMSRRSPYPQELRERAVRMVAKIRPHYETEWAAIIA
jgi:hypothetical protein